MKLKPNNKKRKRVPAGSKTKKGEEHVKIRLGDGTFHTKEHERLGYFVGMWNGEKCQCRVVTVKVLDIENSIHSHPWWKPYIGQDFQAIEISYYGEVFCISNADGSGMQKVTVGKGMMQAKHAQFESVNVLNVMMDMKEWNLEFDFHKSCEIAERGENYWRVRDPEHWKKIKEMRLAYMAVQKGIEDNVKESF